MDEVIALVGARVVDPASGRDQVETVVIEGGAVSSCGPGSGVPAGATRIDCDGLVLCPGLVDMHTHLREPGFEHKETIQSGCRAGAVGGYTAVAPMANTDPVADDAAVVRDVMELAKTAGLADVFPIGAITKGL